MNKFTLNLLLIIPLVISPFSLDAFMIPKVTIFVIYGCIALFYLTLNFKKIYLKTDLRLKILFLLFSVVTMFSFISSKTPWEQQFYGREGRNNGLIIFMSLLLLMMLSAQINIFNFKQKINNYIAASSLVVLGYSSLQLLGLDPLTWDTINIKMFSTLGNPNFLSAFLASSLVPVLIYINSHKVLASMRKDLKLFLPFLISLVYGYVVFKSKSYQGSIIIILSLLLLVILLSYKFKKRLFTIMSSIVFFLVVVIGSLGTLNLGPLGPILYKSSVISRGDFYRSAVKMGNDNWLHGVGIDGFGDYYLAYRDSVAASRSNAEYADTAHNYFLDFFANMGVGGLVLYLSLILLTLVGFIKLLRKSTFDIYVVAIFIFWIGIQIQSLISPTFLVFLIYNFAFAGFVINNLRNQESINDVKPFLKSNSNKASVVLGLALALSISLPFIERDRSLLIAQRGDSLESVLSAARSFPKSIVTYNRIMQSLANAGSPTPIILEVAREAVLFNPRTLPGQFTIMTSEYSSNEEKRFAYRVLLELDPNNPIVEKYKP
jgi:O-antigen ligase